MASVQSAFSTFNFQHQLVQSGQKILCAVSGGIDSLVLVHLLAKLYKSRSIDFQLIAVYVKIEPVALTAYAIDQLQAFFNQLKIPFTIIESDLEAGDDFNCYICSRERRKRLAIFSAENDIDRIALGHHKDDLAETALMNLIFHGSLETPQPTEYFFNGAVTFIRPLLNQSKKQLRQYARQNSISAIPHGCNWAANNKRENIRKLLQDTRAIHKDFRKNLLRAAHRWQRFSEPQEPAEIQSTTADR